MKTSYLVDFAEKYEKPSFKEREGIQSLRPMGPFRLTEGDVRECIKVAYASILSLGLIVKFQASHNDLASCAVLKRMLFFN